MDTFNREAPRARHGGGCRADGFAADLFTTPAGTHDVGPATDHWLILHLGPPVQASCRCDGLRQERLQVHGDIDIVPAGLGGVWQDAQPAEVLRLRFAPALLSRTAAEMEIPDSGLQPRLQLRDSGLEHIGLALKAGIENGTAAEPVLVQSLGRAAAACLLQQFAGPAPRLRRDVLSPRKLDRVVAHVDANLGQDLSLAAIAAIANVSASHFAALFRRSTGQTLHQYVIRRRLARARLLLKATDLPIAEIAAATGFAHQSHLAQQMRRVHGLTPGEIRRCR